MSNTTLLAPRSRRALTRPGPTPGRLAFRPSRVPPASARICRHRPASAGIGPHRAFITRSSRLARSLGPSSRPHHALGMSPLARFRRARGLARTQSGARRSVAARCCRGVRSRSGRRWRASELQRQRPWCPASLHAERGLFWGSRGAVLLKPKKSQGFDGSSEVCREVSMASTRKIAGCQRALGKSLKPAPEMHFGYRRSLKPLPVTPPTCPARS